MHNKKHESSIKKGGITMKKKLLALMLSCALAAGTVGGCGSNDDTESTEKVGKVDDQAAADEVAELIDAIYVQERTDKTDEQCKAAKEAWDNLTDKQKELVQGEYADPDYFGRDTGDASKDDPLNSDDIGENELLVVSFGTSFNDSRVEDISSIEKELQEQFPDWSVRRAFTSQIIINHIQARDEEKIDNVDQALERAVDNKVKNLVIQPTHLMKGIEYEQLMASVDKYKENFEKVTIAQPLLGDVGADETETNTDKENVAKAVVEDAYKDAGYDSLEAAKEDGLAFVLMGHGTSHSAKVTYTQMTKQMSDLGYENVFIGTVEGEPEETACENVIDSVKEAGYKKVVLRPLMVVAGDHANNDMAGDDEDSWKSIFEAENAFDSVESQISGLGSIEAIRTIYVAHAKEAIENQIAVELTSNDKSTEALADGEYTAEFKTDSSMFHVNDAKKGLGDLTVKDGKMTIHISLVSKKISKLYLGKADDAGKDGAQVIEATTDTVTYEDGTTEEVYGFDVPVKSLDKEFDLAIFGSKGTWYDHKVSVTNPQKKSQELADGKYSVNVTLEGGSGKATVNSPATVKVKDGKAYATIVWSSKNYDYMIVNGEKYMNENDGGFSTFTFPVDGLDCKMDVIGDTVAMGTPHEIEYVLTFESANIE